MRIDVQKCIVCVCVCVCVCSNKCFTCNYIFEYNLEEVAAIKNLSKGCTHDYLFHAFLGKGQTRAQLVSSKQTFFIHLLVEVVAQC